MPLYGRAFTNTSGIGHPFQGVGEGSWEAGCWDFKALPRPGAQEHYDHEAGATYSYDNHTKTLVTYDTLDMARRKVQYIKQKKLGGAMWWELSGDKQDSGSIVTNVRIDLPEEFPLAPSGDFQKKCILTGCTGCHGSRRPRAQDELDPLSRLSVRESQDGLSE
jgi:GH18 family chitinase